tara:strand:+ start:454 stop:1392 length:939 start_codon:yes stop_codon:yes gene_type:complete
MNFQYLIPVERSKNYLDVAFRKAREKSNKKLTGEWLEKIRRKEMIRLDVIKDQLTQRLDKVVKSFPNLEQLPEFYVKLLKLTVDFGMFKKSLGAVSWAIGKVRFLHKNYVRQLSKTSERSKIAKLKNEFYGRVSSVVKQIDKELVYLETCRKIMRKYPDIKEKFTVCIFGFPNVGKTTLLNKLTGSKAEVAGYAFTTKNVNSGFLNIKDREIQVLDVPGTLARIEKMNDIEKIAYLVVKELAGIIIYVFDISGVGYSLKKQEELLKTLKRSTKHEKILIYLSKTDLVDKDQIEKFKKKYPVLDLKEVKEKLI